MTDPATPSPAALTDAEYAQRIAHLSKLTPEGMLQELLAVLHSDGGHYADEHGLPRAVAEAEMIFHALTEFEHNAREAEAKWFKDGQPSPAPQAESAPAARPVAGMRWREELWELIRQYARRGTDAQMAADAIEINGHLDALAAPVAAQAQGAMTLQDDEITVNLMRLAGLDKHKARECKNIVRKLIERAAACEPLQHLENNDDR